MEKLTPKQVFKNLVEIYREVETLNADAKVVIEEAKEVLGDEVDAALINKIAKAHAKDQVGKLEDGAKALLAVIEEIV